MAPAATPRAEFRPVECRSPLLVAAGWHERMSADTDNPEIGKSVTTGDLARTITTLGDGEPLLLWHGSGPGVSAWANWRLPIQHLSQIVAGTGPRSSRHRRSARLSATSSAWPARGVREIPASHGS